MSRSPLATDAVRVPLTTVLEQLPRGAVRLAFRDLKRYAQPGTFTGGCELDEALVELPLAEVLARLKGNHLARRPAQKQLSVPDTVPTIFGSRTCPIEKPQTVHLGPIDPRLHDEHNTSRILSQRIPPAPQAAAPAPSLPIPGSHPPPASAAARLSIQMPVPTAPKPVLPKAPDLASRLACQASASKQPDVVSVPIDSLAKTWPDAVRRAVLTTQSASTVHIPLPDLEVAMKRGKAHFTWATIRSWIGPKACHDFPELDSTELELPLAVLAPLFMARRSGCKTPKRVAPSSEIPDIFAPRKSDTAAEVAPTPVSPPVKASDPGLAPTLENRISAGLASALAPTPMPDPVGPQTQSISGKALPLPQPSRLPAEVVQRVCQFGGIVGALLVDFEGQVITSQLPPGINSETAAAFLPEVCRHTNQLAQSLNLPQPAQFEMVLGDTPLQILRTSRAYLAVLGKGGEALPKLQLSSLASQLAQHNQ